MFYFLNKFNDTFNAYIGIGFICVRKTPTLESNIITFFIFSRPTCILGPSEISVYDIVDHQEYKYRTGYIVIRVGGFKVSTCLVGYNIFCFFFV